MNLLKNIATIGSGQNAPQEEREYSVLGKTFIKVSNLDDIIQDQNESRACKITADAINKNKLKLYPKNTIIFAKSGLSCVKNRVYLTKDDSYIVNHLCTISNIKNDYYPKWLLYFIKKYDVTKLIHDESYPSISLKDIGKIEIPEVLLNIQILISNQLDSIIETINKKLVQLNQLNELVKSRFIEMFENKGFPLSTIGNTCVLKSGTTFSKELEQSFGDVLYIKVSDMNLSGNEKYITTSKTFVSKYIAGKTIIPANSVIFPKRGGAIGTNKKRINQCEICIDLNTMAVTPKTGLNIQYLYQYFLNIDMGTLYNGSSVPQINNKDIEPLTIIMPSIELQNEFADFVEQVDKSKFVVQQQIKDLQELLDKKMDEYFSE